MENLFKVLFVVILMLAVAMPVHAGKRALVIAIDVYKDLAIPAS